MQASFSPLVVSKREHTYWGMPSLHGCMNEVAYFILLKSVLLVLQIHYEASALASGEDTLDDKHLVLGILDSLLQVVE